MKSSKSVDHCMLKTWLPLGYEVCCGLRTDYLSIIICSAVPEKLLKGHPEPV